jgi:hypothetical protein
MENNTDDPIEVFAGTAWEVGLVKSLLENAEIEAYVHYGGKGSVAPWNSMGGFPVNRIFVSGADYDKAKQVVDQYYEAGKQSTSL